jgi:protein-disulfide isomerase
MSTKKNLKEERVRTRARQRFIQKLTIGTVLVIIVAIGVFLAVNAKSEPLDPKLLYKNQPMLGKADAPVKIVEFGDFKCSHCKFFTDNEFPKIKKEFIDTGIASFYFINVHLSGLGVDSLTAASAAEAVYAQKPSAFWDYYKAIYNAQQSVEIQWATPDRLVQIARDNNIDVDLERLRKDITNEKYDDVVIEDTRLMSSFKVGGTPTIFINGELTKATTYEQLKPLILKAKDAKK